MEVSYVQTSNMLADSFTRCLPCERHVDFMKSIGILQMPTMLHAALDVDTGTTHITEKRRLDVSDGIQYGRSARLFNFW